MYFGPSVWSMIDDKGENHEPLALTQTCKLLSADCCILCDIYQVDYAACLLIYSQEAADQFHQRREERKTMFLLVPLCCMKAETPQVASEGCEISAQVHGVLPHQSQHQNDLCPMLRLIWAGI